jgi:hypothetical protein
MSDFDRSLSDIRAIQRKLAETLNRVNREGGDRMAALFALLRLARQLLEMLPEGERQMLLDQIVVPFLTGEPVDGDTGRLVTLQ